MRFPFAQAISAALLALAFAANTPAASAQPLPEPLPTSISLGQSAIPLQGPWRFTPGDSPTTSTGLLWAQPDFNDSAWKPIQLTPAQGAIDPAYGTSDYVPGLAANGYPHLIGYAWYRLRIHIADPAQPLAVKMSHHVDDAYQLYANGKYLGELGDFLPNGKVLAFRSRSRVFSLPAPDSHGDITLALRFYLDPTTMLGGNTPDAGGMHEAPILATPATAQAIAANELLLSKHARIAEAREFLYLFALAMAALFAWISSVNDRSYLWLACALLTRAFNLAAVLVALFSYHLYQQQTLGFQFAAQIEALFWVYFWYHWFGFRQGKLILAIVRVASILYALTQVTINTFFLNRLNLFTITLISNPIGLFLQALLCALLVVITIAAIRRNRIEGLLALPAILLLVFSTFSQQLLLSFRIQTTIYPLGISVSIQEIAIFIMVLTVAILMQRRYFGNRMAERLTQQSLAGELEQARELQLRVLVPEPIQIPHLQVQSSYRAAQIVGGDFFQIIPQSDESVLIVLGDVSGKGISAAMLVAVLVGTIRTSAEQKASPAEILRVLNARLLGRAGGHFATCLALHIDRAGNLQIANAGHLPPYLNGKPLTFSGSLPLGLVPNSNLDLEIQHLRLAPGDHLTLLTDGVLEARSPDGSMLGFDITQQLSTLSASQIVEAAVAFGQEDDITVVTIDHQPSPTPQPLTLQPAI